MYTPTHTHTLPTSTHTTTPVLVLALANKGARTHGLLGCLLAHVIGALYGAAKEGSNKNTSA